MELDILHSLKAVGVDTEGAIRRFSGNVSLYEHFLLRFPQDANFQKVSQSMSEENWDLALSAAHALKGVSGNLGMNRLYEACCETCRLLQEGDYPAARRSYLKLRAAYRELMSTPVNSRGDT